jgi:NAD+ kinase
MDGTKPAIGAARHRVILLAPEERPQVLEEARQLLPLIEQSAEVVALDSRFSADMEKLDADLAIVMGGDGSIIRAARLMGYRQIPIVGVNRGRLGFLADLLPEEFKKVWPQICRREYRIVKHLMFEACVFREGRQIRRQLGLNETSVLAGAPFNMLEVTLAVDGEWVTSYSCDGLILSTPVGSTAHNLSAGGPILRQNMQAFVISPISPHTLTNRPIVDDASRSFEMTVKEPNESTSVVVDGRVLCRLEPGDRVRVERAEPTFKLVQVAGRSYYRTLREKLGWGGTLPGANGPDSHS